MPPCRSTCVPEGSHASSVVSTTTQVPRTRDTRSASPCSLSGSVSKTCGPGACPRGGRPALRPFDSAKKPSGAVTMNTTMPHVAAMKSVRQNRVPREPERRLDPDRAGAHGRRRGRRGGRPIVGLGRCRRGWAAGALEGGRVRNRDAIRLVQIAHLIGRPGLESRIAGEAVGVPHLDEVAVAALDGLG